MDFRDKPDLAAVRVGGAVLYATDEFFAEKENLLKPEKPIFIEKKYTDRGKWMDGWESRRKRTSGHDYAIVRLGLPGLVAGVVVDTAFFRGNYPSQCSIDAVSLPGQPSIEDLNDPKLVWTSILGKVDLKGDTENVFEIAPTTRVTHLRLHIYPDGGVARLRVHGTVVPDPRWLGLPGTQQEVDLAALEHGAEVTAASDMFFGSRHNLIGPGRGTHMGDGWETKRSRRDGFDWVILKLAARGTLTRASIDTLHFKGNFPESASLEGIDLKPKASLQQVADADWKPLLARTKLQAHTLHTYEDELVPHNAITHVRMRIWPDGGVSRLRLFGFVQPESRIPLILNFLNTSSFAERKRMFLRVASSVHYAEELAAKAPYYDPFALLMASREVFATLHEGDWNDMFAGHPRIGERKTDRFAMGEQKGVEGASDGVLRALREANEAYENKFRRIYLVCATGKSADELLAIAQSRLQNDAETELQNAKDEQRKIAELRLHKLLRSE